MLRTRVIPCLLLQDGGLVKTLKYDKPKYVGDPINAIKIFNDKEVDELMLLDIDASVQQRGPSFDAIRDVASECFMPLAYGGGIRNLEDVRRILAMGVEKVVLNTAALETPELLTAIKNEFGAQSLIISIDVKKKFWGGYEVVGGRARRKTGMDPVEFARDVVARGAGEILLSAVDRDGTQEGYDLDLVKSVAEAVDVPVIAVGGAAGLGDFAKACAQGAAAVAAGSLFVFTGKHRAVLITYPSPAQLQEILK